MDVLTDEQYRTSDYVCRYTSFPYYYNTQDDKFIYGLTDWINHGIPYVLHTLTDYDTLDSLAFKYYGRPDYYWVIADFNHMVDSLENLQENHKTLMIPTLSAVSFVG